MGEKSGAYLQEVKASASRKGDRIFQQLALNGLRSAVGSID